MEQQLLFAIGIVALIAITIVRFHRKNVRKKLVEWKITAGATVVDVRTPHEFGRGHYPGAVNLPLDSLPKKIETLGSTESTVVVYCASGSRSRVAVSRLKAAGFTDVINGGGLSDLPW